MFVNIVLLKDKHVRDLYTQAECHAITSVDLVLTYEKKTLDYV